MSISAKDVKTLREKTGAGMMDCKKALTEANGDFDKAIELLRKKGLASAGKKASRVAADGAVVAAISQDKKSGALLELNCETDFVAKTDDFKSLASQIATVVLEGTPADVDALMGLSVAGGTVEALITDKTATIGEKITARRFVHYSVNSGVVHSYIHGGGSIGVLLELGSSDQAAVSTEKFEELVHDLCMHIAAAAPTYLKREDVPSAEIEKEIDIYKDQLRKEGKPEEMLEKIAQGKLSKYYQDICLLEQAFVKETKMSITKLLETVGKELSTELSIPRFTRYVLGEGIEKKEEDFAAEVAKMAQ